MQVKIHNKKQSVIDVNPIATGTATTYKMAYLTDDQKISLGLPASTEYAIRIDGTNSAELVKVVNGYTSFKLNATIID